MPRNPWDSLSDCFDTRKPGPEIPAGAANNILIAWPALMRGIEKVQATGCGLQALDFGCGTGTFCARLLAQGYEVIGCDSSSAMLRVARRNLGSALRFMKISQNLAELDGLKLDLITAIMVFQYIKKIDSTCRALTRILRREGILAFAVFDPDFVKTSTGPTALFNTGNKGIGTVMRATNNVCIPVYARSRDYYDNLLQPLGYHRIYSATPRFRAKFLEKYPTMVLVYQRRS